MICKVFETNFVHTAHSEMMRKHFFANILMTKMHFDTNRTIIKTLKNYIYIINILLLCFPYQGLL